MTRDEFVKALEKALSVEALTDVYVKAGMLKLDEPISATFSSGEINRVFAAAERAGIRIVEK